VTTSPAPRDFYDRGSFEKPSHVVCKCTLKTVPDEVVHIDRFGLVVMASPTGKTGYAADWPAVVRAIGWALERSPAVRADVRKLLDRAEINAEIRAFDQKRAAEGSLT